MSKQTASIKKRISDLKMAVLRHAGRMTLDELSNLRAVIDDLDTFVAQAERMVSSASLPLSPVVKGGVEDDPFDPDFEVKK